MSDYTRIEKAIRFLEDNQANQPSLDEIAAHIGLSPYHFQRLFVQWAGVSPKKYLQYLTVESAKKLLAESASVLEASFEVGLSGPSRLHDHFITVEAVTPGQYRNAGEGLQIRYGFAESPFGECFIAVSPRGICALEFVAGENRTDVLAELKSRWGNAEITEDSSAAEETARKLFAGEPLKLLLKGTNFQVKVWEALLKIPSGCVTTYSRIAEYIGSPKASRAVGSAIGSNPIGYIIPCHRVLRNNGEITGYKWGSVRKKAIIAYEQGCAQDVL